MLCLEVSSPGKADFQTVWGFCFCEILPDSYTDQTSLQSTIPFKTKTKTKKVFLNSKPYRKYPLNFFWMFWKTKYFIKTFMFFKLGKNSFTDLLYGLFTTLFFFFFLISQTFVHIMLAIGLNLHLILEYILPVHLCHRYNSNKTIISINSNMKSITIILRKICFN